jgi:serine/threonine-protein kinase
MLDRIGHYRIVAELGRGGMGVVYKAHEESLNRFVAIKVLGEHLTEDPSYVERFVREAQSAARLNHPNIVQIYAISEDAGRHFFVMEYVTGQSLQKILRSRGPLDAIQTARIALQAASGLRAAHEQGIIHRDIKPANLILDDRGLIKIADFGLALMGGAASRLTATGMFMGTPGYLSPEQCLDQDIDLRTDIYSLGVTLFETLTGKAPFTGDSPLALLRQIVEVEPPDIAQLRPEVDPELKALVQRMMAKDRDQRVATCDELIEALEGFLNTRGVSGSLLERLAMATSTGPPPAPVADDLDSKPTTAVSGDLPEPPAPVTASPTEPPPPPPIHSAPQEQDPPRRSGRTLALIAALVVLLGLVTVVVGGLVAWRSGWFGGPARASAEPSEDELASSEALSDLTGGEAAGLAAQGPEVAPEPSTDGEQGGETAPAEPRATVPPPAAAEAERGAEPDAGRRQAAETVAPPAEAAPPPPEGTAVIVVGEQLLAGEAEAYVEAALAGAGIPLVDEVAVPGLPSALAEGDAGRRGDVQAVLAPYAKHLVMVRIEYLGERPLVYMGQRDVAFQARVTMVPIEVATGTPLLQPPIRFRVEYTHLNAQRVVEDTFRQPTYQIMQLLMGN